MLDRLCPDKHLSWRHSPYDIVPWWYPIESLGTEKLCSSLMYASRAKVVPSHRSQKIRLLVLTYEPCILLYREKVFDGSLVEEGDQDKGGARFARFRQTPIDSFHLRRQQPRAQQRSLVFTLTCRSMPDRMLDDLWSSPVP